jgi:mannose-6-phosphate isomerase-like protein (cupin superfamily)
VKNVPVVNIKNQAIHFVTVVIPVYQMTYKKSCTGDSEMDMKKPMKKQSGGSELGNGMMNDFYRKMVGLEIDTNKLIKKVWGWEYWIVNCEQYCGKILIVKKDHICSTHYHQKKHETFHILSGHLYMEYDLDFTERTYWRMAPGDTLIVPPYTKHAFGGITDVKFLEISTQHFEDDSYRDNQSRYVENGAEEWYSNSSKYVNGGQ